MADTTFNPGTVIASTWLNEVNDHVFNDAPPIGTTVHEASKIEVTPYGFVASTNVQAAVQEIVDEFGSLAVDALNVTYTPGGTGATATNVRAKLRQYVSVKDFGAVGDNTTDDTTAIQNALNMAQEVYFPQGTYRITSSLNIPANTIIKGAGRRVSVIRVDGAFIGATRIYGSKLSTNVMKIRIQDMGFQGTATAVAALHFDKGDIVKVDSCDFYDFTASGATGIRMTNVYFWWVSDCKFENIHTFGIRLLSASSVGCNAGICGPNNDFIGNNQASFVGLSMDRGQNINVVSNDFEGSGNGNKAIDMDGTEGILISQNYIELWVNGAISGNNGLGNRRVTIEQNVINANSTQVCNFNDATTPNDRIVFRSNRFADLTGAQTCVFYGSTTNTIFQDNDPSSGIPSDKYTVSPRSVQALFGSVTWDPVSFADGAVLNNNITVTGAAVGDAVAVSFSTLGTRNILISGHVSAANTVRVVLYNREGSAVDLTSGTLSAWVFKS